MKTENVNLDPKRGIRVPQSSDIDHSAQDGPPTVTRIDLGAPKERETNRLDLGPARERAEAEARAQAAHNRPVKRDDDGGQAA